MNDELERALERQGHGECGAGTMGVLLSAGRPLAEWEQVRRVRVFRGLLALCGSGMRNAG